MSTQVEQRDEPHEQDRHPPVAPAALAPPAVLAESHGPDQRLLTVIEPPRGWQLINVRELWRFREMLFFLAWRDIKVRYKQTALGAAWALIQPLTMMIIFSVLFNRRGASQFNADPRFITDPIPYKLFTYAGLVAWTFFATSVSHAGNSVIGSERLITKIYFPRLAVPFAAIGASLVDFLIAFALLLGMMVFYGTAPGPQLLLAPVILGLIGLGALGLGTLLAALNVAYRDFRYVIPFFLQLGMFATASVFMVVDYDQPSESWLHWLVSLNPMIPLVGAFRAAVLGGPIPWGPLGYAAVCVVAMFFLGCFYYRKVEHTFADII